MEKLLAAVEPFKRLTPAERRQIVAVSREKHYAKGETIFRRGQASDAVWVVKTGRRLSSAVQADEIVRAGDAGEHIWERRDR